MNADEVLAKQAGEGGADKPQAKRRGPSEEAIASANRAKTLRRRQLEDMLETRRSAEIGDF
ncbi:hypothetical protein [Silvimonas iriomotensis]|uniref:Uncharacterized protein n=1 Tax=Silvimonas iriomotensis TaxID=449662 RepID=A0ABQ2PAZ9_9NEIS|nr:hypothetical protein [Silvimonas iriomotensis]GGP22178.1 hypothetical protein GCM10010970_23940 [Silvimonas iriomotensis]